MLKIEPIEPLFGSANNFQAIVFCCDNNYVKYLSVVITSLVYNREDDECYDIVIFEDDVSEKNKIKLLDQFKFESNIRIRFINAKKYVEILFGKSELKVRGYWSMATYYRLLIPLIMPGYSKVLYLDTDIAINKNIQQLFKIENNCHQIAAVIDTAAPIFDELKERKRKIQAYGLKNCSKYFNAGVVIFYNDLINKNFYQEKLNGVLKLDLDFYDQDILNLIFQENVLYLHQKFNSQICLMDWNYDLKRLDKYPSFKKEYLDGVKEPVIVHYIGPWKPWKYPDVYGSEFFWKCARKSNFYEEIIFSNLSDTGYLTIDQFNLVNNSRVIYLKYFFYTALSALSLGSAKDKIKIRRNKYHAKIRELKKYGIV